ncbi:hypothetical protein [Mesorhizobium sp. M0678]|uniref:hypothetical protein n=1 Tax=Mesorhizobium sp. M0678 TaxID=2956985 RepID=UPI0033359A34
MERPLAIANGEIATASGPERQDAQAGGVKRTMMTSLTIANAVMMAIGLVPRPECILSRPATLFCRREARDACRKPDSGRKHVGFNTTGHLGI